MQTQDAMSVATQRRLLELNRAFYAQVAGEFDRSRAGLAVGWQELLTFLPASPYEESTDCADDADYRETLKKSVKSAKSADKLLSERPLRVLDVGCGNGRFARALEELARPVCYVGVDGDKTLLALAAQQTAGLSYVHPRFVQADLSTAGWDAPLRKQDLCSDLIVCLAVLHHLPGFALRVRLVQALAALLAPCPRGTRLLAFSNWQFLATPRLAQKQIDWAEVGLRADDVEPGDALLPWRQGGFAIRYVHQIDEAEMARLAEAADLRVLHTFYADGKEGNLNLYSILEHR
jgi:SAM-dependent methyltransferase